MKIFAIISALLCMTFSVYAQNSIEHTVKSGETLASIAAQYGVTEDKVVKDNPSAASLLYPGMKLTISGFSSSSSSSPSASSSTALDFSTGAEDASVKKEVNGYSSDNSASSIGISDFSYFVASYSATFDYPEYGYYGIGGEAFGPGGFGFSLFIGANFGIIDPATVTMLIGPTYGFAVSEHFAVSCPLELGASISSYDKKDHWAFAWRLVPKVLLRFGRLTIFGGFPVTYNFNAKQMGFCWTAGIGIDL